LSLLLIVLVVAAAFAFLFGAQEPRHQQIQGLGCLIPSFAPHNQTQGM